MTFQDWYAVVSLFTWGGIFLAGMSKGIRDRSDLLAAVTTAGLCAGAAGCLFF